ncbi:unconventional myosin-IXAb-like [Brienomyrus brachyistius]|uniref:unconventional myosin-IXAb-like n=1 Tax=Brienomyrus brachyistius TaxID=42636 RepID=UPI0020B2E1CE|nr:unconventional myosin-IXAb-like [Brienomyrus brachyistius]
MVVQQQGRQERRHRQKGRQAGRTSQSCQKHLNNWHTFTRWWATINTLERLVFHIVSGDSLLLPRVAREEPHNRMSTHSLAIIFSSTFLRSPDTMNSPEIMKDMNKATMCLELILNE